MGNAKGERATGPGGKGGEEKPIKKEFRETETGKCVLSAGAKSLCCKLLFPSCLSQGKAQLK